MHLPLRACIWVQDAGCKPAAIREKDNKIFKNMHQTTCMRLAASLLQLDKKDNKFSKKCIKLLGHWRWPLPKTAREDINGHQRRIKPSCSQKGNVRVIETISQQVFHREPYATSSCVSWKGAFHELSHSRKTSWLLRHVMGPQLPRKTL